MGAYAIGMTRVRRAREAFWPMAGLRIGAEQWSECTRGICQ